MPPEGALAASQAAFRQALFAPAAALPADLTARSTPERRFAVYRNNVHASLAATVARSFPVVERLLGAEFFQAMAVHFVERHPPDQPALLFYGAGFPAFLESFPPVAHRPFLPDVARLEWLRAEAYHAADAGTVGLEALAALPPERLAGARLHLHPAARWLASPWPVWAIWHTNTHDAEVRRLGPEAGAQMVLVSRPGLDVLVTELPDGAGPVLDRLREGAALGEAPSAGLEARPGFDLPTFLAALFLAGAVAGVSPPSDLEPGS